jgi:hypothetical protein
MNKSFFFLETTNVIESKLYVDGPYFYAMNLLSSLSYFICRQKGFYAINF